MRYAEMNFDQLRAEMIAAEDGMMFADEAKDYVAMSRWREILNEIWPIYVEAIQADDPHTTEADIRFFEGFKYV